MARAAPAPELRGLVRGYTGFVETSTTPLRRRELPSGNAVLIINFGVPLELEAPGMAKHAVAESFLARISPLPTITEFTGTSAGIEVELSPLGAHLLIGLPMAEVPEPAVGLGELLGGSGRRLTERLEEAPGWEARFELLDAAILSRFALAREPKPSITWAWRALEASAGRVDIARLTERLGCSPRHLIAGFREQIGVTPKVAGRILRVDRAASRLRAPHGGPLARIAAECGYHDQAHMTREFRELAGVTPAAFARAWRPGYLGVPADAE